MHRSWGPCTQLRTAQPSTVSSEEVPSYKRSRRRDTHNKQDWLSQVATVFAEPERVWRKVAEVMDSLGTMLSPRRGNFGLVSCPFYQGNPLPYYKHQLH